MTGAERSRMRNQHQTSIALCVIAGTLIALSPSALGQSGTDARVNPVYLADAPVAVEAIGRAMALSAQGSWGEAARTLNQLMIEQGDRLTPDPDVEGVSIPVRQRIHAALLSDTELLDAYRRINGAKAQRLVDDGNWNEAARSYWLTRAGCDAALNAAQVMIESAQFSAGMRMLDRLLVHPDAMDGASRATALARTLYQARGDERSKALFERWASISGVATGDVQLFTAPRGIDREITGLRSSPIDSTTGIRLDGIVSRPIATALLTPAPASDELMDSQDVPPSGAATQPKPWTMPVVRGDALITNDGITISCFDRFTLRPRWRVTTTSTDTEEQDRSSFGVRSRIARTVEELSGATVVGDRVYVAAGLARTGGRTGDERLMSIDLQSGSIIHQTTLEQLDPSLVGATIRGSVIVDGDTIIVAARKNLRRERLVALSLVGIDRHSFKHLWTRDVGSAGSLPFQQIGQISHSGMLDDGVLYWTDMMGLVCAVETATGDLLWAKATPTSDVYARYEREPWTISTPVVRNGHVFILDVDGQRIDQLDSETGALVQSSRSMNSGQGLYLVETPDRIACVNRTSITMHSIERFGIETPKLITPTGDGRSVIQGRVVDSGSMLLVPIEGGLSVVDTAHTGVRETIGLEQTGIVVALDGQIVVADENTVSSYLSWDIARVILTARMNGDGEAAGDVHAAITLADLAFRSGHHDQILDAVDRAIAMLHELRDSGSSAARDRLFAIMLDMVGLPDMQYADLRAGTVPISEAIRTELLQRSAMVAGTPEQQLAQQMTRGAWYRALRQTREAVRVYHEVLADPMLATGMWRGGGLAIRAEIEATHQLDELVAEHGRDVCAMFDGLALADYEALAADAESGPDEYELLARSYPWAPTTPNAWAMAAMAWFDEDNAPAAVRAAQSGFDATERLMPLGAPVSQSTIDTLGSVLVGGLLESQRQGEAARAATRLSSAYPAIRITINGQPIDAGTLSIGLSSGQRAPVLGERFVVNDRPLLLAGSPVVSPIRSAYDTMVFFAPQLGQARMVRFADGLPEVLWTRRGVDAEPPIAPVHNEFQTVLLWAPPVTDLSGGRVESVETVSGQTRWVLDELGGRLTTHSMREPDEAARLDGQFASPSEGVVQPEQIVSACDGSVLVVSDRIGRAIGIDLLTGQVLWSADLPVNRVHDLDLSAGVLGVVGMWFVDADPANTVVAQRATRIASIDARTGQTIRLLDQQTSTPRWVRVAPSGSLVVGTSQRVMSVSTRTGTMDWVIRSESLLNTNAAWILDDSVIVLDEYVNLWSIGLEDGKTPETALNTTSRIIERGWVDVRACGGSLAVIASGGLGVFDRDGLTLGLDAAQDGWPYVDGAWGNDRVALVRRATSDDGESMHVLVRLLDQHNAALMDTVDLVLPSSIQRQPTNAQAADGVVVVGFGEVSVVLETE